VADSKLVFDIIARDRASDKFSKVGKAADTTSGKFRKFSAAAVPAAAAVGAGLVTLGVHSVRVASDTAESFSKVGVVFGKTAGQVQKFAETTASSLGISKRAALEAAGTLGNLLVAMKLPQPQAAKLSVNMVKLAADMASFNNASPEEALEALRSGLVGETEPLKRFGVNLSVARIEAEALATGLVKPAVNMGLVRVAAIGVEAAEKKLSAAIKEHGANSIEAQKAEASLILARQRQEKALGGQKVALTEAQKAQAAYGLIMKDTATAHGDFARTSDGLANQQRILKARFDDLSGQLGTKLLPAVNSAAEGLLKFTDFVARNKDVMVPLAAALATATAGIWAMNIAMAANPVGLVIVAIAGLAAGLVIAYKKSETFRNIVNTAFKVVATSALTMVSTILLGLQKLFGILAKVPGPFQDNFRKASAAIAGARDKVDRLRESIAAVKPKKVDVVANVKGTDKVRNLIDHIAGVRGKSVQVAVNVSGTAALERVLNAPLRAHGGPVRAGHPYIVGEEGPEILVPRQSGTVIPNNKAMGGGSALGARGGDSGVTMVNINVHGSLIGGSTQRLARELGDVIVAAVSERRNDLRLRLR
jgi:hypothetical protein